MTTTTNFKKWAGYLLLTGIFLFSSMEHVSAFKAPVCVPIENPILLFFQQSMVVPEVQ